MSGHAFKQSMCCKCVEVRLLCQNMHVITSGLLNSVSKGTSTAPPKAGLQSSPPPAFYINQANRGEAQRKYSRLSGGCQYTELRRE